MANVVFHAQFTAGGVGATGKTVTVDVDRITRSDGTRTAVVTGGGATEGIRGCYRYALTGVDLQTYDYLAIFVTADTAVDQREIPALSPADAPDNAGVAAIKLKTDLIDSLVGPTGTVAASPAPTTAGFTAVESLGMAANAHAGQYLVFLGTTATVALRGVPRVISSHSGDPPAFVLVAVLPAAPAAGDVFAIVGKG